MLENRPKLLTQTLKGYLMLATVLLLLFIPISYFLFQKIYLKDVDDGLSLEKDEFILHSLPKLKIHQIPTWNLYNRDCKVLKNIHHISRTTILTKTFNDSLVNELEPYRVLYSPIRIEGDSFLLMVKQNLVEEVDWVKEITVVLLILLLLIIIGTTLLTKWLNAKLWAPFYENLLILENFSIENKPELPQFSSSNIDEFNRLSIVLKQLIQRSISSYKIQKEFAENAAHELQTPVAILKSKIDTFLQLQDLTDEQIQILMSVNEVTGRLKLLNKNLLLLSHLDQHIVAFTEIDVKDLLEPFWDFWEEQCLEKEIRLNKEHIYSSKQLANKDLVILLINNLLLNAVRHNKQYGEISINLSNNFFEIKNNGSSIPLDVQKIFLRFVKNNSSGHGLGLAIVKKVVELHGWRINYTFENNFHVFRIYF